MTIPTFPFEASKSTQAVYLFKLFKKFKDNAVLEALFEKNPIIHVRDSEFSNKMYSGKNPISKIAVRPSNLKLDMYELYEKDLFDIGSYEDYKAIFRAHHTDDVVLCSFAHFVLLAADHDDLVSIESITKFVKEKAAFWYQKRFIHTVWEGKQREALFGKYAAQALPKGWSIKKTTVKQDQTLMVDYIIFDGDVPQLGVSVKGQSYERAKQRGNSTWQIQGEVRELEGQKKFKKQFGCDVVYAISSVIVNEAKQAAVDVVAKATGVKAPVEYFVF